MLANYNVSDTTVLMVIDGVGDKRAKVIGSQTTTTMLALIAVVLRFWARRIARTKLSWEDWFILPALAGSLLWYWVMWWDIHYGFARYIGEVTFFKLRIGFIAIWITSFCYALVIGFAKLSICALYSRAFGTERWARIYIQTMALITGLWIIAVCHPIDHFWNRQGPGKCREDIKTFYLATGIVDIATDCALMALPLYLCSRLKLGRTNKLLLCTVFASGCFVTVVSAVRIQTILALDLKSMEAFNITWTYAEMGIMSSADVNIAVVCACLPTLRPLVAKVIPESMVPSSLKRRSADPRGPADRGHIMKAGEGRAYGSPRRPHLSPLQSQSSQLAGLLDETSPSSLATTLIDIEERCSDENIFSYRKESEYFKDLEAGITRPAAVYDRTSSTPSSPSLSTLSNDGRDQMFRLPC